MSKPYYSILTNIGENLVAKATALGTKLDLTTMAVGDGNGKLPAPDPAQTKLINEKRRAAVNSLEIDKNNPNIIIVEHIIPETEGGWWVREIGLFDSEGNLIAVGNCPETYKPRMIEGSGRTQIIRMMIVVKSTECIELKADPSVVLATRDYVNETLVIQNEKLDNLKEDLSNEKGSDLIGFSQSETYESGSIGDAIKNIRVNISSLGLSKDISDEDSNAILLNEKLIELHNKGISEIYMDEERPVNPGYDYQKHTYERRVTHLTDFKFYGPHRFTSSTPYNGLYNVSVENELCSEPVLSNDSNIEITKPFKKDIKVVVMGDSISLDWADSLTLGVSQWSIIKAELQAQNPEHTFTFINRAIGGQTWANANTKPTSFRSPWYTDSSKNWVDYVIDTDADIVILAFGMNDRDSFNAGTMISTINKLKVGLPHAHYIMCTCLVPSRSSAYNNGSSFDGLRYQEGRNFAAGFERTYAKWAGFSVFDFNRYFVQARDGKDQLACELIEIPDQVPKNGAYIGDACVDFAFEALVTNWDKTKPIYVNNGGDANHPDGDWIYVGADDENNFVISGVTEFLGNYHSKKTNVKVPSNDFWFVITVLNNECHIYIGLDAKNNEGEIVEPKDGTNNIHLDSFYMVRHGGTVRPKIGMGGIQSGTISKIRVMLGQPTQRKKILTDSEMWGRADNLPYRKPIFGGNGINHPSSQGLAKIITPVLQSQDLKIKFQELSLNISLSENVTTFLSKPTAIIKNGILFLKGDVKGSGVVAGATIGKIERWVEFNQKDSLVPVVGANNDGESWGTRVLRIKSTGDLVLEETLPNSVGGLMLSNVSVLLS